MRNTYYIRLYVHKKMISYCVNDGRGTIHAEGAIPATRFDLDRWDENTAAAMDGNDGGNGGTACSLPT